MSLLNNVQSGRTWFSRGFSSKNYGGIEWILYPRCWFVIIYPVQLDLSTTLGPTGIGTMPIVLYGTEEQKENMFLN